MKKFLYLLLALPLLGFMTSCDDDDKDLPDVSLQIGYEGGTVDENGVLNVVQGTPLDITSLKAIPAEGTKEATITRVVYYLDGMPIANAMIAPFAIEIPTVNLEPGTYALTVQATVLQTGKSVGFAVARYPFTIVEDQTPGDGSDNGGGSGTITPETKITDNEK